MVAINGLIITKENGGNTPCFEWEPTAEMVNYDIADKLHTASSVYSPDDDDDT